MKVKKKTFSYWILALGDGWIGDFNNGETDADIPHSLIVKNSHEPIQV